MKTARILVFCHKDDVRADALPYLPIHVGKKLSNVELGIIGDDTGENISDKNRSYCELTGMYWAWKNLKDVDVIGLCHYRRYFDFHGSCRKGFPHTAFHTKDFPSLDLSIPQDIIERVSDGSDVVVARPRTLRSSLLYDYCVCHFSEDFKTLQQVVATLYPEYIDAFVHVMHKNNKLIPYNMCLMSWKDYDDYCTWLFAILEKVESLTDISNYTSVQARIYGYMAERLFNVWLYEKKKNLIKKPVIMITDDEEWHAPQSLIKTKALNLYRDFTVWIQGLYPPIIPVSKLDSDK